MARQKPIEIFMPPNVLKTKVGTMAPPDEGTFRAADKALAEAKQDFAKWLDEDAERLASAREEVNGAPASADARMKLARSAQALKAQALNCDFPIVARVAQSLIVLLDKGRTAKAITAKLLNAHVDAIRLMIRDGIKDGANPVSKALALELEDKVSAWTAD